MEAVKLQRSALAMLAILVVLGVGVYLLQSKNPATPENATVYVLSAPPGDVRRIDVTASAGSTAFERLDPVGWKFADSGVQADTSRVDSVVNRLAMLRSNSKVLGTVPDLSAYGLDPPAASAVLTMKDGTTHRVLIGKETVNNANYYALVEEFGVLHTINTLIEGDVQKLVSDPPVPTPTAGPSASSSPTGATVTPTPEGLGTPTPTIGLPLPSVP
ncbi:MAG TPA: DUF4340 domain-containing protein [Chloroflexota bacterium]